MSQCGKVATNTCYKLWCAVKYGKIFGGDQINQHCVNSFSMSLKKMDICL